MTRDDRALLKGVWLHWSSGRTVNNQTCHEFLDQVIRPDPKFAHVHVFEVLDLVINVEPERRSA